MDSIHKRRKMMDPRLEVINDRLKDIKNIIAVSGGKGGVGKSLVASNLALVLSEMGHEVGLLDLDFLGPSSDMILGIEDLEFPEEDKGITPKEVKGLKWMSVLPYSKNRSLALRGSEISDALLELLSITRWGKLDFLILDMPPGISDETLDLIRLLDNLKFLIVTTGSKLALETMKRELKILRRHDIEILGIIRNMDIGDSIIKEVKRLNVNYLGHIGFDEGIEDALGEKEELLKTNFFKELRFLIKNAKKINS